MMTSAQRSALHRIARLAVQRKDWGALDAYVSAYAERARSSLDRDAINVTVNAQPDGTQAMPGPARPVLSLIAPTFWQRNRGLAVALAVVGGVCAGLLLAAMP